MNNQELIDEVNKWNNLFASAAPNDNSLYELAFFKIFIKFEKFLSDCFENYAIGNTSIHGYSPARRLSFDDLDHLNQIIKRESRTFINHFELIKTISDCFFSDNPFNIIKTDATYSNILNQMKIIRDYIAHESPAAKGKYIQSVLNNRPFVEPHVHLLTIKKGINKSHYSFYIESMTIISNYIINTPNSGLET